MSQHKRMIYKVFQRSLLIFFSVLSVVSGANAQDRQLQGLYQGAADAAPYGKVPVEAELFVKDNQVSGKIITPLGDLNIIEGARSENDLSLKLDLSGSDLLYRGTIGADGGIKGNLSSAIVKGTLELSRVADAPDRSIKYVQSKKKWREDLRFLASELARKHKNAFHRVSKKEFEKAVAALDARIPTLDDERIIVEMSRIAAMIGDGHTSFAWNWEYQRLPIRFFWFGKELRVVKTPREYPRLNGAKVLKINGVKIEDVFARSQPYIAQGESPQFVSDASQYLLRFPAFLKVVTGKVSASDRAEIEAIDLDGKKFSQIVEAVSPDAKVELIAPYQKASLYLQNEDKPISFDYLKENDAVYVNFRSYPRRAEFAAFSKQLFDFIEQNKAQKLIIDLRGNGGGNFNAGREFLLNPIKARKNLLDPGNLFVIIGRKTFSAAMVNADDFKKQANAILVGEPTGARPNNYGEVRSSTLPNSRIPIRYSTEYYKFSEREVPSLAPDVLIEPNWKSFLTGKDKVLEYILKS